MLLQYTVRNYGPIFEEQTFSLVSSKLKGPESGLIPVDNSDTLRAIPVAVIYGANASGKSSLLEAFAFIRTSILYSQSRHPDAGIRRVHFLLNDAAENITSDFSVDLIADDIHYHYGFKCDDKEFTEEWLHSYPRGRRQILFERKGSEFQFGRKLKGRNAVIADLTRPNSLFLSAAAQNDHTEISPIWNFFKSVTILQDLDIPNQMGVEEAKVDKRAIAFLEEIGTGVVDFRQKEKIMSDSEVSAFRQILSTVMPDNAEYSIPDKFYQIELGHRNNLGEVVYLKGALESAGTRRLLSILNPVFNCLDNGTLVMVDELDLSLHSQACEAVLALFSSKTTNPKGAQLIATTHDTNLLGYKLLRRDQIWFTEKSLDGATSVYPLTDINIKVGDNIEKGYLQGRFGAVPFAGSPDELVKGIAG